MGFAIGMAMFGAIVFIPLYLQLVYGVSPTSSGLRMLPLMAGLLVAAIASGRVISRIGRYKPFPIAGTAILVVGMYLLSLLRVGTAPWLASVYMLVVGVGHRPRDAGARARRPERRAAGGHRRRDLDRDLLPLRRRLLRRRASSAPSSPAGSRDQLARLPQSITARLGSGVHLNPEQAKHLPAAVHADFLQAFAHALHGVFLFGMVLAAVPFLLSWLLKEVPLRTTLGTGAELGAAGAAGGSPDERMLATGTTKHASTARRPPSAQAE